jgi:NAD+ synthase
LSNDQQKIAAALGVAPKFDVAMEVRLRTEFLAQYLLRSSCRAYVLGISGGVDSLAAGLLAKAAVCQLRAEGRDAQFMPFDYRMEHRLTKQTREMPSTLSSPTEP